MKSVIVAGWVLALGMQGNAPPFVQYGAQFGDYAVLASSIGSCGGMGYETDQARAGDIEDALVAQAVRSGIGVGMARAMISEAVAREIEDMEFLQSQVDRDDRAAVESYLDFWIDRCNALARDKRYSGAVSFPRERDE